MATNSPLWGIAAPCADADLHNDDDDGKLADTKGSAGYGGRGDEEEEEGAHTGTRWWRFIARCFYQAELKGMHI